MSNSTNTINKNVCVKELKALSVLLETEHPFGPPTNVQRSNTMTKEEMNSMYEKMYDTPLPMILDLMKKAELAKVKSAEAKKSQELTPGEKFFYDKMINIAAKQIAVLRQLPAYKKHMGEQEDARRAENRKSSEASLAAMSPEEKRMQNIYAQYGGKSNYESGDGANRGLGGT